MWLTSHNTILIKDNLAIRGWVGDHTCQFCSYAETVAHLFLTCSLAQQVWFWLGKSQNYMHTWTQFDNIVTFAMQLLVTKRLVFLVVLSVVCWTLWKHRNARCFTNCRVNSARTLILQIKSLFCYWSGNIREGVQEEIEGWMPVLEDVIPLDHYMPREMVLYQPQKTHPQPWESLRTIFCI